FSVYLFRTYSTTTALYPLSLHDALPISCTPVKTARPDPRRGSRAIAIPPPTTGICGRYQLPVGGIREQYAHPSFLSIEIGVKLRDRKSTRLNSSHGSISYAVFCLKKKKE